MIDAAAYRANETNAKRAIASWRLSNINDPYVFQNQGFPVRADSFLDLAQILDTMQEGRFDSYMREMGGFTEEDTRFFVKVCLDYIDFYSSIFQRERVVVPLSTLISHFVIYRKLLGYNPGFTRVLELGPGCGYLSFFLRHHAPLADYTQIESTESFYLLQSHINAHLFGSRFAEQALSRHALDDHGVYIPKLNWHNQFHYEEQKIVHVEPQSICNHYPWWRIDEVSKRRYDIVTSNANLNEFSREALFQYLSLIRDVLANNGAIVAQCLGGGAPSYDTIFANMKSAGFVPVGLVQKSDLPGKDFVVANGVFVGEGHPLYKEYADRTPQFPTLDRGLNFMNKMYYQNEEHAERKRIRSAPEILEEILNRIGDNSSPQSGQGSHDEVRQSGAPAPDTGKDVLSAGMRGENRLRKVAQLEGFEPKISAARVSRANTEMAGRWQTSRGEIQSLKDEIAALRSSRSWRVTAPLRFFGKRARRMPMLVRLVRWMRTRWPAS